MTPGQLELIRRIRALMHIRDMHEVTEATVKASIQMALYTLTDEGMEKIPIREITMRIHRDNPSQVDMSVIHALVIKHIGKLVSEGLLIRSDDDHYIATEQCLEAGASYKLYIDQYRKLYPDKDP